MKTLLYATFALTACYLLFDFLKKRKRKRLFNLAYQLGLNGHTINAIKVYDRLIKLSPPNYIFYNNRGHCYLILENVEMARADFKKSIELEPDLLENFNAYENMERLESLIKNDNF